MNYELKVYKALRHKKNPNLWGRLQDKGISVNELPDPMKETVKRDDLLGYLQYPEVLDDFDLVTVYACIEVSGL